MKTYTVVDVVVRHVPASNARFKWATEIALFLGPQLLATKNIGGWYSQVQGLSEFLRNSNTFKEHVEGGRALALSLLIRKKAA